MTKFWRRKRWRRWTAGWRIGGGGICACLFAVVAAVVVSLSEGRLRRQRDDVINAISHSSDRHHHHHHPPLRRQQFTLGRRRQRGNLGDDDSGWRRQGPDNRWGRPPRHRRRGQTTRPTKSRPGHYLYSGQGRRFDDGINGVGEQNSNFHGALSNLTPPRGQRRRPRPRRHRRRRRRRFRENNARPDDVSPLLSSSKRNHFRLREKDHRLQRPRGPGDSRSLIHGEEDIDVIEGFDFSPPTDHLFDGEFDVGNGIIIEELPFVGVDMGDQDIIIVDEEEGDHSNGLGYHSLHHGTHGHFEADHAGYHGYKPEEVTHDLPLYEPQRPPKRRKRRKKRKRPREHHDHFAVEHEGFDHVDHHHNFEPEYNKVVDDGGFGHGLNDFGKDHFEEGDFDHAGYFHENHHDDHRHPNEIGDYHGGGGGFDEQRGGGGFEHDGFPDHHHQPEPIKHEYHGPPPPEDHHHDDSGCHTDHGLFGPGESWPLDDGDPCGRAVCSRSLHGGHEVWEERCKGKIKNPQYACVIHQNLELPFPHCCPKPTECRDDI